MSSLKKNGTNICCNICQSLQIKADIYHACTFVNRKKGKSYA